MSLVELSYNNSFRTSIGMVSFEALYRRKCPSPVYWIEVGKRKLLGLEIVQLMTEKIKLIQQWVKMAQSCCKSYADVRRRPLKFQVGDNVFFKILPSKGIV